MIEGGDTMGNTIPISFFSSDKYMYKPFFPDEEMWIWLEVYEDGKKGYVIIPQYFLNEKGELIKRSFREIDQDKLIGFQMMSKDKKVFTFNITKDDNFRLIHFYRNIQTFEMNTGRVLHSSRYPIQGYQKTVNGKNVKVMVKFFNDGSFELSDND